MPFLTALFPLFEDTLKIDIKKTIHHCWPHNLYIYIYKSFPIENFNCMDVDSALTTLFHNFFLCFSFCFVIVRGNRWEEITLLLYIPTELPVFIPENTLTQLMTSYSHKVITHYWVKENIFYELMCIFCLFLAAST